MNRLYRSLVTNQAMLKTRQSHTKTLAQVRAATLAEVKRLLARPHVVASAVKRIKKIASR